MKKLFFKMLKYLFFRKSISLDRPLNNILIFKTGAIGDVLMSTPLLRSIRKIFPKAKITYSTGNWSKEVLENNNNVDKIFIFDEKIFFKRKIFGLLKLIYNIKKSRYDVVFILDKSWVINLLFLFTGIKIRVGFDREGEGFCNSFSINYGNVKHESEYYLSLISFFNNKIKNNLKIDLFLTNKDKKKAYKFIKNNYISSEKLIAIAPGGARNPGQDMKIRRWPEKNFELLINKLIIKGYKVILVGGKSDEEFIKNMLRINNVFNAVGKFSVRESAALLKYAKLLVCNDSGLMHIAAAVNVPTISIFGATDPRRKAPIGKIHNYLWNKIDCKKAEMFAVYESEELKRNILKISVNDVFNKIKVFK